MINFSRHQRLAGVLLHPGSLPGGTLTGARQWLDFMDAAGLKVWQVLPLGVPHEDQSPYACLSAFAMNPALLEDMQPVNADDADFRQWRRREQHWLQDYVLFQSLRGQYGNTAWYDWPAAHKYRQAAALDDYQLSHADELTTLAWQQYRLHCTWMDIKHAASERQIHLFGDMPIFVAHDSADVWAHPERFLLDDSGQPRLVTGVPPDYFSDTGQRWGNPHYNWEVMQADGFRWWLDRLHHHFELFDLLRVDHFRGLEAVWMIDARCETAVEGHWQRVPGDALLQQLQDEMGEIPLIAEDLGIITPEVVALRNRFKLPGMAVLQFSFDNHADNPHKPQNIVPDCVVYTGTHDNDTTLGWFNSLGDEQQHTVIETLGIDADDDVVDAMIDTALACAANLAIIPLQDLLKLGPEARMNTPGTTAGNWQWRFQWSQLTPSLSQTLHRRIRQTQRDPEDTHAGSSAHVTVMAMPVHNEEGG